MTKIRSETPDRICQGSIFRNVDFIESAGEADGIITVSSIRFPFVIVLTQDCDLKSDHDATASSAESQNASLLSVIVAPMYNFEHFRLGDHLEKLGRKMELFNTKSVKRLKQNENKRFHYLDFRSSEVQLPDSVIDFKHYFAVATEHLISGEGPEQICQVDELFREDISQRFASFLSRIGLPPEKPGSGPSSVEPADSTRSAT